MSFLPRRQGRHFSLEQYTRALWLASFEATFKLDKVAGATIQSFDGARSKLIQSDDCIALLSKDLGILSKGTTSGYLINLNIDMVDVHTRLHLSCLVCH